jgi:hypothetical protein
VAEVHFLDGDVTVQRLVVGVPDRTHAAATDRVEQAIPCGE